MRSGVAPTGNPEAVLDASTVKGGGKAATEVVGVVDVTRGEAVIVFGWATADALANGLGHLRLDPPRHAAERLGEGGVDLRPGARPGS